MTRRDIISKISIEFIMSNEEAEKIVDTVFQIMSESLKSLDIPKFGEFRIIQSESDNIKSIKFSPSNKLSKRVNYCFSDLINAELQNTEPEIVKRNDEFSYTISKEFLKQKKESEKDSDDIQPVKEEVSTDGENMKKLISEELVKLHKEIIELGNGSEEKRTNLWG